LDDSYEIFRDLKHDILGESTKPVSNIMHYQKVIVAKDAVCEKCGSPIFKGSQVFLGETKVGAKQYFCNNCFAE
jgi:thymidine kinase